VSGEHPAVAPCGRKEGFSPESALPSRSDGRRDRGQPGVSRDRLDGCVGPAYRAERRLHGGHHPSDSNAWAVGSENAELNGVGAKVLIDHQNGTEPTGTTQAQTLTLAWNSTAWVTVASPNASSGLSILNSVATTPGATIVQAVGASGASGPTNPLALQHG